MDKIKVSGLTSNDLKLPVYADPYSCGPRPALRRGVKAMPGKVRVEFGDDKPREFTDAAVGSWLAVLSTLFLFAAGMVALACMSGCSAHVPNLFGGTEHKGHQNKADDTETTICPDCGEKIKKPKHGNNGNHFGQLKHHCKLPRSNG